jgi:hypothetical protein
VKSPGSRVAGKALKECFRFAENARVVGEREESVHGMYVHRPGVAPFRKCGAVPGDGSTDLRVRPPLRLQAHDGEKCVLGVAPGGAVAPSRPPVSHGRRFLQRIDAAAGACCLTLANSPEIQGFRRKGPGCADTTRRV